LEGIVNAGSQPRNFLTTGSRPEEWIHHNDERDLVPREVEEEKHWISYLPPNMCLKSENEGKSPSKGT